MKHIICTIITFLSFSIICSAQEPNLTLSDTFPKITVPIIPQPFTPSSDFWGIKVLPIPARDKKKLIDAGVFTINDFFINPETKKILSPNQYKLTKRALTVSLLTSDITLQQILQDKELNSIQDFVDLSKTTGLTGAAVDSTPIVDFKNRVLALDQVRKSFITHNLVNQRNPRLRLGSETIDPKIFDIDVTDLYPDDCLECTPDNNLFSPAVYLLYLMDFVQSTFDIRRVSDIEKIFNQSFSSIPLQQDLSIEGSYVEYANEILLNYLLIGETEDPEKKYDFWNEQTFLEAEFRNIKSLLFIEINDPSRADYVFENSSDDFKNKYHRFKFKMAIYDSFKANTATQQVPYPDVVEGLFDSYVTEFKTSRIDLRFLMLGGRSFATEYAQDKDLTYEDLVAINKTVGDSNQPLTFISVTELKNRLLGYYERQFDAIVKQERISDIAYDYKLKFGRRFREEWKEEVESLIGDSLRLLPAMPNNTSFPKILSELKSMAYDCLVLGADNCPSSSQAGQYPLFSVQKLFEYYADYYPDYNPDNYTSLTNAADKKNAFSREKTRALLDNIRAERIQYLLIAYNQDASKIIESDTLLFAEQRIQARAILDEQIRILAELVLNEELLIPENREAFDWEVKTRAREEWKLAVRRAEMGFHSQIRENLLKTISIKFSEINAAPSNWERTNLGSYLFLDLSVTEDYRTSPIAFSISRIHTFIQAIRLGINNNGYKLEAINNDIWDWLSSYSTFHTAMMVTLYPENFLSPDFRHNKTHQFKGNFCDGNDLGCFEESLIAPASGLEEITNQYWDDVNYLNNLNPIGVVEKSGNSYVFASMEEGSVFYSIINSNDEFVKSWTPLELDATTITGDIADKPIKVITAKYREDTYVFLFLFTKLISEEGVITFTPYAAKLKLGEGVLEPEVTTENWELIPNISLSFPQIRHLPYAINYNSHPYLNLSNLLFIGRRHELRETPNLAFIIGYIDPSQVEGRLVIAEEKLPKYESHSFNHSILDESFSNINVTRGIDFNSKWLENVIAVETDPNGETMIWVKAIKGSNDEVTSSFFYSEFSSEYEYNSSYIPKGNIPKPFIDSLPYDKDSYIRISPGGENVFISNSNILIQNRLTSETLDTDDEVKVIGDNPLSIIFKDKGLYYRKRNGNTILEERYYLTEPNLSEIIKNEYASTLDIEEIINGPASIYNEEALFHIPDGISKALNNSLEPKPNRALLWLNKIINLNNLNENEILSHPFFKDLGNYRIGRLAGSLIEDPFDPYEFAEAGVEIYYADIKFSYINTLLGQADALFAQDDIESVNRARELYELAQQILNLGAEPDSCAIGEYNFYTTLKALPPNSVGNLIADGMSRSFVNPNYLNIDLSGVESNSTRIATTIIQSKSKNITFSTTSEMLNRDNAKIYNSDEFDEIILPAYQAPNQPEIDIVKDVPVFELKPFCLPQNPRFKLLRWRVESNLEKIRTNRNYAGMERNLPFYATPISADRVLNARARGYDISTLRGGQQNAIPIYKYGFLIERAKYLIGIAEKYESSLLNTTEKWDAANFDILKAKQDIRLESANISLQNTRLIEASTAINLATEQFARTEDQFNNYDNLIGEGLIGWEEASLGQQYTSAASYGLASAAGISQVFKLDFTKSAEYAAASASALGAAFQTEATYERREQEWKFQRQLATRDKQIASIGIGMAIDRVNIINQERRIAELRQEIAQDVLTFISKKEANHLLYQWLIQNYRQLHRQTLYQAISTSKMAERALTFELKTNLDFIGYGYADYMNDDYDKYIGASKLLQDLNQLEQFRINNKRRNNEITKTFSLARIAPTSFLSFRETGILQFETLKAWFDRDYPGHYRRLIKDIDVTVIGLTSATSGIKGTLMNPGISRIMNGPPYEDLSVIYKYPESFSLDMFKINTESRDDEALLMPFEGLGVATSWILEMPKGANAIDYNSIADIFFTIKYTSSEDRSYRQKVLDEMGMDPYGYVNTESKRYFSVKNEFPDEWYRLFNPSSFHGANNYDPMASGVYIESQVLPPQTIVLDIGKEDFVPNEEHKTIRKVTLAAQVNGEIGEEIDIPFRLRFIPYFGSSRAFIDMPITDNFIDTQRLNGLSPFGYWVIDLLAIPDELRSPASGKDCLDSEKLEDILLIIDYEAKIHYNR